MVKRNFSIMYWLKVFVHVHNLLEKLHQKKVFSCCENEEKKYYKEDEEVKCGIRKKKSQFFTQIISKV